MALLMGERKFVNKPSLLIIGKIPPPIGGVTIHIDRLLCSLKKNFIDYDFYDYGKESCIRGIKKIYVAKIIHVHLSNKNIRLFFVLFLKFIHKKIIITFHGKYSFDDFRDYLSLYISSYSFVLNQYTYKNAAKRIQANKLGLISSFIPPYEDNILTEDVCNQIEKLLKNKKYILCTNASNYVIDKNGHDLYGIDFLIDFIKTKNDLCLIISDPSGRLKTQYPIKN
jgi:glycosyltransferase involved in cell wall biosynthesis